LGDRHLGANKTRQEKSKKSLGGLRPSNLFDDDFDPHHFYVPEHD
jgi:hypothetical protein